MCGGGRGGKETVFIVGREQTYKARALRRPDVDITPRRGLPTPWIIERRKVGPQQVIVVNLAAPLGAKCIVGLGALPLSCKFLTRPVRRGCVKLTDIRVLEQVS